MSVISSAVNITVHSSGAVRDPRVSGTARRDVHDAWQATVMWTRTIGPVEVSKIGLGAMPMSVEHRPDEGRSVAAVHAALDAGVTLIDTANAYHTRDDAVGHNEMLIARALREYGGDTSDVFLATKGGGIRTPDGGWTHDGSPEHLREACEASLRRLRVDTIDLYQYHRPDPTVPYEESMGALRDLVDAGKVRMAGISNADPAQIRIAQDALGDRLAAVQNQLSPRFRTSEPELELCTELGLAFLPWSPLGGIGRAGDLGGTFGVFGEVATARGTSPQQVCLAWLLAKSPVVIPIPGASRPESIRDSVGAADLELTPEEFAQLDVPS